MTCKKCNDTGWFKYNHNHSAICDECCTHDEGVWLLQECHGEDKVGKPCCYKGCGTIWDTVEDYEKELGIKAVKGQDAYGNTWYKEKKHD